jgi:DNA (cytosine-5)-methyltransferase 1
MRKPIVSASRIHNALDRGVRIVEGEGLKFATVCSGIGAPEVAWHPLGWESVFFSEIEKFPSVVLAHHYPDTPNYGDMLNFKEWPDHELDLICGGTPCQSFSVAGLRIELVSKI